MSKRNSRAAKAARRKAREHWQVTDRPGFYSAVRDDGLGVTIQAVTPAMLESDEEMACGCTPYDLLHGEWHSLDELD